MKLLGILFATGLLGGPLAAQTQDKPAPEKQRISFKLSNSNTKYTQQHVLDVGDVPGHQIRILEVHRTFQGGAVATNAQPANTRGAASASNASDTPVFNGIRAKEQWVQGVSDYVNGTGHVFGYATTIMENGDKVYSRYEAMNQTGGNGRGNTLYVTTITGGTGQFKTLRGLLRGTGALTFSEGRVTSNDVQYEGEYWNDR